MSWAKFAIQSLQQGQSVQVRPRGHSMKGKVNDGALVRLEPCDTDKLQVGDVVPDVVWISQERLADAFSTDGHLHAAPEIVIEVLSPGSVNERRDREAKLKLYSRRGVSQYWIVDWRKRQIEVHRREEAQLKILNTLYDADTLTTPMLPGFACKVADIFEGILA